MDEPPRRPAPERFNDTERCGRSNRRNATVDDVRAMCSILRHGGPGIFDVDLHGTGRGHPARSGVTRATRDEETRRAEERSSWRRSGCVVKTYLEAA